METAILRRLRSQDAALLATLARVEVLAERPDERLPSAMSELGGRLRAHVIVSEELVLRRLRESPGPWVQTLADLESEHARLRADFESDLEWSAHPARAELARFAQRLRRHLAHELSLLHQVGDAPRARLARLPLWRVDDLYERAGGVAESWPEKWLG